MSRRLFAALVALVATVSAGPALGHPFHVTSLEADWVATTEELQVALRVDPEALNLAMTDRMGAPLKLTALEGPREDLAAFVADAVVFTTAAGERAPLRYRGHKVEKDGVWLFFVVELSGGLKGATVLSRAFLDREPKQMNAVVIRDGEDLVFSKMFTGRSRAPAQLR